MAGRPLRPGPPDPIRVGAFLICRRPRPHGSLRHGEQPGRGNVSGSPAGHSRLVVQEAEDAVLRQGAGFNLLRRPVRPCRHACHDGAILYRDEAQRQVVGGGRHGGQGERGAGQREKLQVRRDPPEYVEQKLRHVGQARDSLGREPRWGLEPEGVLFLKLLRPPCGFFMCGPPKKEKGSGVFD